MSRQPGQRGFIDRRLFQHERANQAIAARGKKTIMNNQAVPGGFTLLPTPLVRVESRETGNIARQFLVSVMPPTRGDGTTPYLSTFDGQAGAYPSGIYTAPQLPDIASALQISLQWGAGGVRYVTAFDYPAVGGVYALTADALDVSVNVKGAQVINYNSQNLIPVIGAFYVEGQPVDPTPMGWAEPNVSIAGLGEASWAVKPFTKDVNLVVGTTGAAVERFAVTFKNTLGTAISLADYLVQAPGSFVQTLQVPRQATVMTITNRTATAKDIYMEWGIGIS